MVWCVWRYAGRLRFTKSDILYSQSCDTKPTMKRTKREDYEGREWQEVFKSFLKKPWEAYAALPHKHYIAFTRRLDISPCGRRFRLAKKPVGCPTRFLRKTESSWIKNATKMVRERRIKSKTKHKYSVTKTARKTFLRAARASKAVSQRTVDGYRLRFASHIPQSNPYMLKVATQNPTNWNALLRAIRRNN